MALLFPKPKAETCPKGCGVPIVNGEDNKRPVTVHTGTWQARCIPKSKG